MDKFCMNYAEQSMTYKLCSMSVQSGSLNGGHYYAVCNTTVNNTDVKNMNDNKWKVFNDSNVFDIDFSDMMQQKPYCLFYKRI